MTDTLQIVAKALERNQMKAYIVKNREEARRLALSMITKADVVGAGGSITLEQCGILQELRSKRYKFLDRVQERDKDKRRQLQKAILTCDVFLSSANAVTMDGKLVNIDGWGNRVSAMIYGPAKVIIIAGKNKIAKDLESAIERVRNVAAPKNCIRLNKKTPCVKTGRCMDCDTPDRICSSLVVLERQQSERIHVILVQEDLGF